MSCTRKDHNAVTPVRLESVALRSRVKNSEPLRSPSDGLELSISVELVTTCAGKNQKNICTGTYLCWEEPKEHVYWYLPVLGRTKRTCVLVLTCAGKNQKNMLL